MARLRLTGTRLPVYARGARSARAEADEAAITGRVIGSTHYAQSGGYSIAYQVVGHGPDLVLIPGFVSNVEVIWELPAAARFLDRLASFSRLIMFDKRGTGLSDRVPIDHLPSLEERVDDVRSVMEAAGSGRATLLGVSEGGPMAILLAATDPSRVDGLILYGSYSRRERAAGVDDRRDRFIARIEETWGTGEVFAGRSRSVAADPATREFLARYERHSASPQGAAAIVRMGYEIDVTDVLASISVPTLVLHRAEDPNIRPEGGRELAESIPGARFVELPGVDHMPFFGDVEGMLAEIEHFVTGSRPQARGDRVLATVLFVDLVRSTEIAGSLGDARWRDTLDSFYATTRATLGKYRGREVNTTGDGFLATFDGPARAVRSALEIAAGVARLGLTIRAGVHTGEIEVRGDDISGIAVHIGARISSAAAAGEVWVSRTVKDLVAGSGLVFAPRGVHPLKGVPEPWELHAAVA